MPGIADRLELIFEEPVDAELGTIHRLSRQINVLEQQAAKLKKELVEAKQHLVDCLGRAVRQRFPEVDITIDEGYCLLQYTGNAIRCEPMPMAGRWRISGNKRLLAEEVAEADCASAVGLAKVVGQVLMSSD